MGAPSMSGGGGRLLKITVFTGDGVFIPDPAAKSFEVDCTGHGGGLVATSGSYPHSSCGGGGARAIKCIQRKDIGPSVAVEVGEGNPTDAKPTKFGDLCVADYGRAASYSTTVISTGGIGGRASNCVGDIVMSGSNGGGSNSLFGGQSAYSPMYNVTPRSNGVTFGAGCVGNSASGAACDGGSGICIVKEYG